jgi:23S rRNA pseudouridine1911/1915/1917 synthase
MAYAGHPLIGDPLYAAGGGIKPRPGLPGDGGYSLHAERLQFAHPSTGQPMTVTATPPPELQTQAELVTASALAR